MCPPLSHRASLAQSLPTSQSVCEDIRIDTKKARSNTANAWQLLIAARLLWLILLSSSAPLTRQRQLSTVLLAAINKTTYEKHPTRVRSRLLVSLLDEELCPVCEYKLVDQRVLAIHMSCVCAEPTAPRCHRPCRSGVGCIEPLF